MRPIIGITQDVEYKKDGVSFWAYLDKNYAEAIYRFGGMPLMIPIVSDPDAVKDIAGRIDGLLLSGGDDIHPRYYGEECAPETCLSPDLRTDYDFALLREMLALKKPVLGICLGIQTINIYFGGKLHQDITGHKAQDTDLRHEVKVTGERLRAITGADAVTVNSYHHQAIKEVAAVLTVSAMSADGIVEAVEMPGEPFVLGVQWHPERMRDDEVSERLFRKFIEECGRG